MAVRFDKAHESFDGFDPKTGYQMVPAGGTRGGLSLITEDEEVEAAFDTPRIARMQDRSFSPPSPLPFGDYAVRLAPRTTFRFTLAGERAGNTTLVVRNRQGKPVAGLLVSVKDLVTKTYSLCRLSDMRRNCPWPEQQLRPMMRMVHDTFLQQANIKLVEGAAQIFDVGINDRDLGDPLIPERVIAPERVELATFIWSRCPTPAVLVDFTVVFVWDLFSFKHGQIVGETFGRRTCFVEYNSTVPRENALTAGHEIGHGLGLDHTGKDSLMAGDGNSRTSLLAQFEIDMINRTDEQAPP